MMIYNCDVCGVKAHKADIETGKFFCTQTCFDTVEKKKAPHCVPFYDLYDVLAENRAFRKILYTDEKAQFVVMYLKPTEKIGDEADANKPEVHPNATQMMRVEEGEVTVTLYNDNNEPRRRVMNYDNVDVIIIPSGKYHLVENTGGKPAQLSIIYSPPVH
jgi:oxalate decarboxylase/phosphoglucose isomerase-like protein (cupin superfamily)